MSPVLAEGAKLAPAASVAPRTLRGVLTERVAGIHKSRKSGGRGKLSSGERRELDRLFNGGGRQQSAVRVGDAAAPTVINDEGIPVGGRAAQYYKEVRRIVEKYKGVVGLEESLDVMDDSYGDVWAKLKALESVAADRGVEGHNTHLERTLTWVDGVMNDRGRNVAVHTYRAYYHPAENPRSEIEEGIKRADSYLEDTARIFLTNGKAEREMGRFDEVVLAFDARGYAEIKDHLKGREAQFRKAFGDRFTFVYLDEIAEMPKTEQETRDELNALIKKYGHEEGLGKIIEGVIYSRYVGLLLELKTVEHFVDRAHDLLQSGHELFDEEGKYVTELDLIVRSPEGKVILVEAKSARVPLPFEEVLRDKVVKKLDTYLKHWGQLEESAGQPIDEVWFSFDVGPNQALADYLMGKERYLSEKYGFPVRFLFIDSSPQKDDSQGAKKGNKKKRKRR
ncbi:hypothetical protein ACFL2T_05560 [Elusimicrobiota bacterium]